MAAEPILASTLWAAYEPTQAETSNPPTKRKKLPADCQSIDKAFRDGLEYGRIHCISAEVDSDAKEICYTFLKSHLLDDEQAYATIVDTSNSFDVRKLHGILVSSLRGSNKAGDIQAQALEALERVRITRAFDFVGLTESIAEVREDLENSRRHSLAQEPGSQTTQVKPRGTIGDSEDEEDIMLDARKEEHGHQLQSDTRTSPSPSCGLLIIDNITQVATPLLKTNHAQGQALLISFMRSLGHLARAHNLCTVMFNSAITYQRRTATEAVSIFSSCLSRPAIGQSFSYLVDTHSLLHKLPLSVVDAKAVYGTQTGAARAHVHAASVLEVLQDRYSNRVGCWAAFTADGQGKLKAIS